MSENNGEDRNCDVCGNPGNTAHDLTWEPGYVGWVCEKCGVPGCENCGENQKPEHRGITIKHGMFVGCWVCSKKCRRELLGLNSPLVPSEESLRREERRQMGITF